MVHICQPREVIGRERLVRPNDEIKSAALVFIGVVHWIIRVNDGYDQINMTENAAVI